MIFFYEASVNAIIFISFLVCLFLLYKDATDCCVLILYSAILLNVLINSKYYSRPLYDLLNIESTACYFPGTPNSDDYYIYDSFACSWDSFSRFGLPCPVLI